MFELQASGYRLRLLGGRCYITSMPKPLVKQTGFTIVELLIVIVVIAILATLTIVAYNGIQTRSKNVKTTVAVAAWVKAFKLYQADNNSYPPTNSCLGDVGTYPANKCSSTYGWYVESQFTTPMEQYFGQGQLPEPDITESGNTSDRYRGAFYIYDPSSPIIDYVQINASTCPTIGGLAIYEISTFSDGGVYCRGKL